MLNVDFLGQVFTQSDTVDNMLRLRKNQGSVLEPSCGSGAFFHKIPNCVGVEYDSTVCPQQAFNMDFFDYSIENKFDTIIGNPPYVKYANISTDTKDKLKSELFDERSNLYLFFIEKCIRHLKDNGELIFIVPRDFIKATSSIKLNQYIFSQGTITDWIELGDEIVFLGFNPNCVIFRFEKDNFSRVTNNHQQFFEKNGQLLFLNNNNHYAFSDYFFVKVGGVSGADDIFTSENGNVEFVCSKTKSTGKTKTMHYNNYHIELELNKHILLQRKIRQFSENNWYMWGRNYFHSDLPRIYVNNKTRQKNPFFIHDCTAYDGSVLAVFPKFKIKDKKHLQEVCDFLNSIDWEGYGFKCDGRFLFNQKSLENSLIDKIPF